MNCKKIFVSVSVDFDSDGKITPRAVRFENGYTLKIRKISNITRAASLRAGGQGTRYTCTAGSSEFYLFYEEPRWFVEGAE